MLGRAARDRSRGVCGVAAGDRLGVGHRGKRRFRGGRKLLVRDVRSGLARETAPAVGVLIEDRAYLLAREGRETLLDQGGHVGVGSSRIQVGGDAELLADRGDVLGRHAGALQSRDERFLGVQHALGRQLHVVFRRVPDVVVDLHERPGAVLGRCDVDLPGVVRAGRDAVEVREADL